ncbi:MAG: hypothetical protein ACI8RZ_005072 [Myxococcota bacterium]|jgi:hypothetical protein
MSLVALMMACTPQEPEDVRGTAPGDPSTPTPLTTEIGGVVVCTDGPAFPDAWAGAVDPALVTTTPYDFAAGIGDILDAAPASGALSIDIAVTDAVVANFTEYSGEIDQLWLADAGGGLQTFGPDIGLTAEEIAPGDTVSFVATEITTYFSLPELTGLTDLSVTGAGGLVYVIPGNTTTITVADHLNQNIRAFGELVSEPETCGGSSSCADFVFGDNTVALRFADAIGLSMGDCVDVLAPLTLFSGAPQLNIDNNDWVSVY